MCLARLHEQGQFSDEFTIQFAAKYGHLGCLRYLWERGCSYNEWVTESAADNGHLDCLGYAWAKGCPCHEEVREKLPETAEWRAASKIADAWAAAYWSPYTKIGRKRLDREYVKLNA